MGLIKALMGWGSPKDLGTAVGQVAEVFVANKSAAQKFKHLEKKNALDQFGLEFKNRSETFFDSFINGLNRLPRPVMALGTVGLFVFAMVNPVAFRARMVGLDAIPDPLWWLLGAVVSFYFGAREMHYMRNGKRPQKATIVSAPRNVGSPVPKTQKAGRSKHDPKYNAALEDWRNSVASKS